MRRVQVIVSRKRALAIILALAAVIGGIAAWLAFQPTRFADGTPVWTSTIVDGAAGSPPPRLGPTAGYDASSNRMMVFGGAAYNDVWVLSNANGLGGTSVWTNTVAQGAGMSSPWRGGHSAVYDAASNRMVMFGGYNDTTYYNDVWVLSNANGLGGTPGWTNTVAQGAAGSPLGRVQPAAVYDASGKRMILFGGDIFTTYYNDVWVLSNANATP